MRAEVDWRRAYLRLLAHFAQDRIHTGLDIMDMSAKSNNLAVGLSEDEIIIAFPMIKNACYDIAKIQDFKSYLQDSINDVEKVDCKINNHLLIYEVMR